VLLQVVHALHARRAPRHGPLHLCDGTTTAAAASTTTTTTTTTTNTTTTNTTTAATTTTTTTAARFGQTSRHNANAQANADDARHRCGTDAGTATSG
jgi:hypothetical protein